MGSHQLVIFNCNRFCGYPRGIGFSIPYGTQSAKPIASGQQKKNGGTTEVIK